MIAILQALVQALLPVAAAFVFFQVIKKYVLPFLDRQPAIVQQFIVVIEAAAFSKLGAILGVTLPQTFAGFDANTVQTILQALSTIAMHNIFKTVTNPPAPSPAQAP